MAVDGSASHKGMIQTQTVRAASGPVKQRYTITVTIFAAVILSENSKWRSLSGSHIGPSWAPAPLSTVGYLLLADENVPQCWPGCYIPDKGGPLALVVGCSHSRHAA